MLFKTGAKRQDGGRSGAFSCNRECQLAALRISEERSDRAGDGTLMMLKTIVSPELGGVATVAATADNRG